MTTLYFDIGKPLALGLAVGVVRHYPRFFKIELNSDTWPSQSVTSTTVNVLNLSSVLLYSARTIFLIENNRVRYLKNRQTHPDSDTTHEVSNEQLVQMLISELMLQR